MSHSPSTAKAVPHASVVSLVLAFLAIYIIWGSTYFAIRVGVETVPPFLMAGARFVLAGVLLFLWARLRSPAPVRPVFWRSAVIVGGLMLCGGNGLVTWAERSVPSAIAAILIAGVPLFMVGLDRSFFGGPRLTPLTIAGVALGIAGITFLVAPDRTSLSSVDPMGSVALVCACLFWALGSLYSRRAPRSASPLQSTAMEMIAGGLVLMLVSAVTGELSSFDPRSVSLRSFVAWAYLVFFGSLIAFSAYMWLLRVTTASAVSTYAFVNPVVAIVIGVVFGGEVLTPRALFASFLVLVAVACIHVANVRRARSKGNRIPVTSNEPAPKEGNPTREAVRGLAAERRLA